MYVGPDPLWPWYVQGIAVGVGIALMIGAARLSRDAGPSAEDVARRYRDSHGRQ